MRTLLLLLVTGVCVTAGCATHHAHCSPPIICPQCNQHCRLEVEKVTEEKTCYEVECQPICIPHVKLPWADCCAPPRCAKTRLVHVLVEKEYECEHCRYKWTPECCEACAGCNQPEPALLPK